MLTIERVKEIAMELYGKGGDSIIECYEDEEIQKLIEEFGINTEKKLRDWIRHQHEVDEEYRKAALWHAYGTTDETEIAKMNEKIISEMEDEYDPCEGCHRFDAGYNCKHCPYGDDGHYSVTDVYTPSELGVR